MGYSELGYQKIAWDRSSCEAICAQMDFASFQVNLILYLSFFKFFLVGINVFIREINKAKM